MANGVTECCVLTMQLEATSESTTFGGKNGGKKQAIKKKKKKGKL